MTNLYEERDHLALGDDYLRHVDAMTREGLHAKSAIAAELAYRDARIRQLEAALTWRAVEDVPEDGTFLVYMPTDTRRPMQVARWHPNCKVIGGAFAFDCDPVTHWMPLPPAPVTSTVAPPA